MEQWSAFRAACLCQQKLQTMGLDIEVTSDGDRVLETVNDSGKPYLTPWLDPRHNDFSSENFFWIVAKNGEGPQIVGGGRLDNFGGDPAGGIHRLFVRGYGPDAVLAVNPACTEALRGRVMYLGDLYSRATGGLGRRAIRYYLGLANYLSTVQFKADVAMSFMRKSDVHRGSADVNGFSDRIYSPLKWGSVPDELDETGVLVYRPRPQDASYFGEIIQELGSSALPQSIPRPGSEPSSQAEMRAL